jgi:hypothetical protein
MPKGKTAMRTVVLFSLATMAVSAETIDSKFTTHFTVNNPPCLVVPGTVTGDANVHQVLRVTRNTDGTYRLDVNRIMQGTARDTNGNTYEFHDVDHFFMDESSTAPAATPPFTLIGTGKVALISKGKAPNVKLFMLIKWLVNADGSITDLGSVFEGDLSCDPSTQLE